MGDDYFDDDDLINDYIEEEDIPPEYDDAFLEEMVHQQEENAANEPTTTENEIKIPSTSATQIETATEPIRTTLDENNKIVDTEELHNDSGLPQEITVGSRGKEDFLYKFERYQGGHNWRRKPKESANTIVATRWKSQNDVKVMSSEAKGEHASNNNTISSAPDLQLVEFLDTNLIHNQKLSMKPKEIKLFPVAGRDSLPMTLADGRRIHVAKKSKPREVSTKHANKSSSGHILGVPMSELLRKSDAIKRKSERQKKLRKNNTIQEDIGDDDELRQDDEEENGDEKMERLKNPCMDDNDNACSPLKNPYLHDREDADSDSEAEDKRDKNFKRSQLWVDKHAPTQFSHLLSDERTNREVLRALRAWDPYVFRRDPPARPLSVQMKMQNQQNQQSSSNNDSKKSNVTNGQEGSPASNDIRPDASNRVILLSGPPGVGKTTLAHIIARHAGYRPVEVNGSDERSTSLLKDRVLRANESTTLNFSNGEDDSLMGQPNCLILDEIDGADAKGAVSAIVDIIRAEIPDKKNNGGSKKSKSQYLRRPIIFICNHKYAPALRPLLPFARHFDVSPPSSVRLVARLRAVLSAERLSLMSGSSLLHKLVAGTGGDIRSCLYTLQFASTRAREVALKKMLDDSEDRIKRDSVMVDISQTLGSALGSNGNGMKDARNDVAGTVTTVFRKPKVQRLGDEISSGSHTKNQRSLSGGVGHVLQMVDNFADNSKTIDCLFTNLLRVSYIDPTLDKMVAAHEWISSVDIYRSQKTSVASNNFAEHNAMQRYHMPTAAAAVHLLCRVETKSDLMFSTRQLTDSRYQQEANSGLVNKFIEGFTTKARCGANSKNAITETVPYSLWMLSAGVGGCSLNRSVSSFELLKVNERISFEAHVATLRSLGLTYVAVEDALMNSFGKQLPITPMRIEPQIDRLVQYNDLSLPAMKRRREIPSALKELLAHFAAVEGMRQREADAIISKEADAEKENKAGNNKSSDPVKDKIVKSPTQKKHKTDETDTVSNQPKKRSKIVNLSSNFLGINAAKAKAAKTARKAARVGFDRSKKLKLSNTGSGIPFTRVVRFRYQKGFTQAVRTPCLQQDLL